jgi:hypothetical protein
MLGFIPPSRGAAPHRGAPKTTGLPLQVPQTTASESVLATGPFFGDRHRVHLICFAKSRMDYFPNQDGVVWFVQEVLPEMRWRDTKLQFSGVGTETQSSLTEAAWARRGQRSPARSSMCVPIWRTPGFFFAPLRVARGIQNKVIEARPIGRPALTSPALGL